MGGIKYGQEGARLCSVRSRHEIRLRLKEAFLVSGELAGKKVGSLIRLSQTYPSSASGNHPRWLEQTSSPAFINQATH